MKEYSKLTQEKNKRNSDTQSPKTSCSGEIKRR